MQKKMLLVFSSLLLVSLGSLAQAQVSPADRGFPKPRELSREEEVELTKLLGMHFQQEPGKEVQYRAAGVFRFINTPRFRYIDRTDTGSLAFENPNYGIADKSLEVSVVSKDTLLPRVEGSLRKARLEAYGMQFSRFNDEFAAAARPDLLPHDFDPRRAGIHVARTAVFEREIEGVPIFGSELIVGLMPEGPIGRLRMHWPKIDSQLVARARALQKSVQAADWKVPESLRRSDTEILETRAGVGHSGFADPGFKAAAVVRVLYRTSSADREYPLQTTGYKYFDESGREILFHAFPRLAATPKDRKPGVNDGDKQ